MPKSFIIFVATLSLICCIPVIRRTINYDEEKLTYCLKTWARMDYNETIEELRSYRDELRYYLYKKKIVEYKLDRYYESEMITCFDKYGQKAPNVSYGSDCYDKCHDETPGQNCNCPRL